MSIRAFLFGQKDWVSVWEESADFEVCFPLKSSGGWEIRTAFYHIEFSASRNKYRLRLSGFPEGRNHSMYQKAKDTLDHYNNQL